MISFDLLAVSALLLNLNKVRDDLDLTGKDNALYPPRSGICLETEFFPDGVNHPDWPQPIVKAGKPWQSTTSFVFSVV